MKTAMHQLLEIYRKEIDSNTLNNDQNYTLTWAIYMAENLLEKEKEQIIEAHLEGWSDAYDYLECDCNDQARQAEDYFNETYNQNK